MGVLRNRSRGGGAGQSPREKAGSLRKGGAIALRILCFLLCAAFALFAAGFAYLLYIIHSNNINLDYAFFG